ncbi:hypothetical protein [Mucilaginibacter mallensis]|nr:hypothetical protein [Mucilaginibacter mallensis]
MSITFYDAALVGHIIGITLMAGAAFIDLAAFQIFWKVFLKDPAEGVRLEKYLNKLQKFMGIGMLVILISGILMMVKMHEVWGAQLWFRIKMGVLLLIIINGLGLRRMLGSRLKRTLAAYFTGVDIAEAMVKLKNRLMTVQTIQVLLFIIIYVLSIFKFN